MVHPRKPLLLLTGAWTFIGLAAVWWDPAAIAWKVAGIVLAIAALADLFGLLRIPTPRVARVAQHNLPQGVWSQVSLILENRSRRPLRLRVHDLHPPEFEVRDLPRELVAVPGESVSIDYRMHPPQRGNFSLPGCDLLLISPSALWGRKRCLDLPTRVRVLPNLAEISHYTLLAAHDRLGRMGVRVRPRRGIGGEFHQLREYRRGDSPRQIDWKATSRVRKLISREYQDERDQRILFLLDCGRRMRHTNGTRGHLDEALNALLLLAYVAVRQGDSVGLMTYGGHRRWLAPRKDADAVNRLLNAAYDLQPTLDAADPLVAGRELMQALNRRALVVMLTNTRDEEGPELQAAIRLLSTRHLVVVADLRESDLDRALDAPIEDRASALRFNAVQDYLEARHRHHERLQHNGAHVLDLPPSQLPIALVNRYLELKRAGEL